MTPSRLGIVMLACLLSACGGAGNLENSNYPIVPITPQLVGMLERQESPLAFTDTEPKPESDYVYRIGAGDVLSLRLWDGIETPNIKGYAGLEEQTFAVNVEDNGVASFPYVGSMSVNQMTIATLRQTLSQKLGRYFRSPRFELQLQQARSQQVAVTGAVEKPGVQYLSFEPLTVMKAIEKAGGALPFADLEDVTIVHADGTRDRINGLALLHAGDASQDRVLKPGDTLLLPQRHRNAVYLMGDLLKTGTIYIRAGRMSLTEALNTAEGPNRESQGPNNITGITGTIYVIRGASVADDTVLDATPPMQSDVTIYTIDSQDPVYYAVANRFPLKPQDVVFVSAAPITEWHRFITQLLPVNVSASRAIQ